MAKATTTAVLLLLTFTVVLAHNGHDHHGHHNHHDNNRCVECKYCKDNWCWQNCKKDCRQKEQGINIERCKSYGNDAGWKAAKAACDLTQTYCRGSQRSFGAPQRTKVSLAQCGNAAYGVCQAKAMDRRQSPCGSKFDGMERCSKQDFMYFYTGEVDWQCNQATAVFDKN